MLPVWHSRCWSFGFGEGVNNEARVSPTTAALSTTAASQLLTRFRLPAGFEGEGGPEPAEDPYVDGDDDEAVAAGRALTMWKEEKVLIFEIVGVYVCRVEDWSGWMKKHRLEQLECALYTRRAVPRQTCSPNQ